MIVWVKLANLMSYAVGIQAFLLAIFSKLKGGKTQRFSKLKQIFCKTQGKYLKTQYFGNFCCGGPLFNVAN